MARKGGNPEIAKYGFKSPPGVEKPRTSIFQLRVDEDLRARLKKYPTEKLREALAEMCDRLDGVE